MVARAQIEYRDEAKHLRNGRGDDEDICAASAYISELDVQLLVIVVEETALD